MTTFLVALIRIMLALSGVLLALLGTYGIIYALSDRAWGPAFSAFLGTVFACWLVFVGVTGRLTGRTSIESAPSV